MKTIVYVDGLNLYYGSLRGTPFKWLDLYTLFRDCMLEVDAELEQVRYYTAPAKASSSDDPASPMRQQRYLHALKAHRGERIQSLRDSFRAPHPYSA
jgi:6-hydroxy-3-succinoylpyridine 3-monooxygenase